MNTLPRVLRFGLVSLMTVGLVAACGDDDETGSSSSSNPTGGNGGTASGGDGGSAASGGTAGQGGAGAMGGMGGNGGTPMSGINCTTGTGEGPALGREIVANGFSAPVLAKSPIGDPDRLFVVEKGGVVKIIHLADNSVTTFLDISSKVNSVASERGLLGLAFHPEFMSNGRFFVHYSDAAGDTTIEEYAASGDTADANGVQLILNRNQPSNNHNGGSIEFGPNDGYLYVFLGDGGSQFDPDDNGQDAQTHLAAILRVDIDGNDCSSPTEECFTAPAGGYPAGLPEVWGIGVRNPWRSSFDACTGDLYIGDVGQDAWEEINWISAGTENPNFGWSEMEGTLCVGGGTNCDMSGKISPVIVEGHTDNPCDSIVGGVVYRGSAIPDLNGTYFYSDSCLAYVKSLRIDNRQAVQLQTHPALGNLQVVSFGSDDSGEAYIVDYGGGVWRIVAQ